MNLPFRADDLGQPLELLRHPLVALDHVVERVGDLAGDARPLDRQPHREVAFLERGEREQQLRLVDVAGGARRSVPAVGACQR